MVRRSRIPQKQGSPDGFQTPSKALVPLVPYLHRGWTIWECAAGKGNLVRGLELVRYDVYATDILTGHDFLRQAPAAEFECIVTNPPYSLKDDFIERCYGYEKPFALLMPLTALEGERKQRLYRKHGIQLIVPNQRINFETPYGVDQGSWFATAWFTWKLNLPKDINFVDIRGKSLEQLALL